MRYIDVEWIHDHDDEPVRLVSEIGPDEFEVRKIEIYRDGNVGFADKNREVGNARLGIVEVPSLTEINSQLEFRGSEISCEMFENLWSKYVPSNS